MVQGFPSTLLLNLLNLRLPLSLAVQEVMKAPQHIAKVK